MVIDISYNHINAEKSKKSIPALLAGIGKGDGYIRNCFIKPNSDDTMFRIIKDSSSGKEYLVPSLDKYAIIPVDDYQVYQKWLKRKSRVKILNTGRPK